MRKADRPTETIEGTNSSLIQPINEVLLTRSDSASQDRVRDNQQRDTVATRDHRIGSQPQRKETADERTADGRRAAPLGP